MRARASNPIAIFAVRCFDHASFKEKIGETGASLDRFYFFFHTVASPSYETVP